MDMNNEHETVTSEPAWQAAAPEPEPADAPRRKFFNSRGRIAGLIAVCGV
jgi:hypothetical protein